MLLKFFTHNLYIIVEFKSFDRLERNLTENNPWCLGQFKRDVTHPTNQSS